MTITDLDGPVFTGARTPLADWDETRGIPSTPPMQLAAIYRAAARILDEWTTALDSGLDRDYADAQSVENRELDRFGGGLWALIRCARPECEALLVDGYVIDRAETPVRGIRRRWCDQDCLDAHG